MTDQRTQFTSPLGGVTTTEVGIIGGDLEAWLDGTCVAVAYAGASDVYHVKGTAPEGVGIDEIVAWLSRDPGVDEDGNPKETDLTDFAPTVSAPTTPSSGGYPGNPVADRFDPPVEIPKEGSPQA